MNEVVLKAVLGADDSGLQKGLKNATESINNFASVSARSFAAAGEVSKRFGDQLAGALAAARLQSDRLTASTAEQRISIDALGISYAKLSAADREQIGLIAEQIAVNEELSATMAASAAEIAKEAAVTASLDSALAAARLQFQKLTAATAEEKAALDTLGVSLQTLSAEQRAQVSLIAEQTAANEALATSQEAASAAASGFFSRIGGLPGVVLATTAAIVELTSVTADFQQLTQRVQANTGISDGNLQGMRENIISLGKESGASFEQLAGGYQRVVDYGFQGADATTVLTVAMKGAVATGASVESMAAAVAGALHNYNMSADEASHVTDTLMIAARRGRSTFGEFTEAIAPALATARAYGVGIGETASLISAMTEHQITASRAVTSYSALIRAIANPTKATREAAAALGHEYGVNLTRDIGAAALSHKGLVAILTDVNRATQGHIDRIKALFPEVRAQSAAITALSIGQKDFKDNLSATSDTMSGKLTPSQDGYNKALGDYNVQFGRVKNSMQAIAISAGNTLLPALTSLSKGFADLSDGQQKFIFATGTLVAGTILIKIASQITGIVTAARAAWAAIMGPVGIVAALAYLAYLSGTSIADGMNKHSDALIADAGKTALQHTKDNIAAINQVKKDLSAAFETPSGPKGSLIETFTPQDRSRHLMHAQNTIDDLGILPGVSWTDVNAGTYKSVLAQLDAAKVKNEKFEKALQIQHDAAAKRRPKLVAPGKPKAPGVHTGDHGPGADDTLAKYRQGLKDAAAAAKEAARETKQHAREVASAYKELFNTIKPRELDKFEVRAFNLNDKLGGFLDVIGDPKHITQAGKDAWAATQQALRTNHEQSLAYDQKLRDERAKAAAMAHKRAVAPIVAGEKQVSDFMAHETARHMKLVNKQDPDAAAPAMDTRHQLAERWWKKPFEELSAGHQLAITSAAQLVDADSALNAANKATAKSAHEAARVAARETVKTAKEQVKAYDQVAKGLAELAAKYDVFAGKQNRFQDVVTRLGVDPAQVEALRPQIQQVADAEKFLDELEKHRKKLQEITKDVQGPFTHAFEQAFSRGRLSAKGFLRDLEIDFRQTLRKLAAEAASAAIAKVIMKALGTLGGKAGDFFNADKLKTQAEKASLALGVASLALKTASGTMLANALAAAAAITASAAALAAATAAAGGGGDSGSAGSGTGSGLGGTLGSVVGTVLGSIFHFAEGSWEVPGGGYRDSVPAMLTPGEMVVPRDRAQAIRNGDTGGDTHFHGPVTFNDQADVRRIRAVTTQQRQMKLRLGT
jgi:TP901 family phage tail tape measure protein